MQKIPLQLRKFKYVGVAFQRKGLPYPYEEPSYATHSGRNRRRWLRQHLHSFVVIVLETRPSTNVVESKLVKSFDSPSRENLTTRRCKNQKQN